MSAVPQTERQHKQPLQSLVHSRLFSKLGSCHHRMTLVVNAAHTYLLQQSLMALLVHRFPWQCIHPTSLPQNCSSTKYIPPTKLPTKFVQFRHTLHHRETICSTRRSYLVHECLTCSQSVPKQGTPMGTHSCHPHIQDPPRSGSESCPQCTPEPHHCLRKWLSCHRLHHQTMWFDQLC